MLKIRNDLVLSFKKSITLSKLKQNKYNSIDKQIPYKIGFIAVKIFAILWYMIIYIYDHATSVRGICKELYNMHGGGHCSVRCLEVSLEMKHQMLQWIKHVYKM